MLRFDNFPNEATEPPSIDKKLDISQQELALGAIDYAGAIAYKVSGVKHDEDVRQDAFLGLTQAAQRFDHTGPAKFTTFAYRRIVGEVVDGVNHRKNQKVVSRGLDLPNASFPDEDEIIEELDRPLLVEQLKSNLEALVPTQREVIRRHFFGGVPISQIAAEEGVSFQAINQRKKTALRHLAAQLAVWA